MPDSVGLPTPLGGRRVLFTGERFFLERHRRLIEASAAFAGDVSTLELASHATRERALLAGPLVRFTMTRLLESRGALASQILSPRRVLQAYNKSAASFISRSKRFEREIGRLPRQPDAVVHIFGLSGPFYRRRDIPYAHFLDYTYRLALQNNPSEIPLATAGSIDRWLACERASYAGATQLFAMSAAVRNSLVSDYGIDERKIRVVGSGGNLGPSLRPKAFGSQLLLFNASDFERKGGDIVLAAFARMRADNPALRLITVGRPLPTGSGPRDGVEQRGAITRAAMRDLLDTADLVLAPSRSDPFPGFVIEAAESGTPSIVTDRDGMPEIVLDDITGIVLHEPTPETLAREALRLLADPARLERFSHECRRRVANVLNWNAVAKAMSPFLCGRGEAG